MTHPAIFVDLDGVLADYEGEYRRHGGDPAEKGGVKANRFKSMPNFYLHLPLLPDAMRLWNFVKQFHPSILSAASNYQKTSKADKLVWVERHLDLTGPRVIVVNYPNEKWKHCTPGAILIDDNAKNCDEWEKAGGIAIRHVSTAKTLPKLKELLGHSGDTVSTQNVEEAFEKLSEDNQEMALIEAGMYFEWMDWKEQNTVKTPYLIEAFEELKKAS